MDDYDQKVKAQINQFKYTENLYDFPAITNYWLKKHIQPVMQSVLGATSTEIFFSTYLVKKFIPHSDASIILSLGCGDCWLECFIAEELRKAGVSSFQIECIDISPILLDRAEKRISDADLKDHFRLIEADINSWNASSSYIGVMANHTLHHILELEKLIGNIKRTLHPEGTFVCCDMIGRNGHMRWPEALKIIESMWAFLPDRYKFHHQLKQCHERFINWDCSQEGFEGVRSQDILPLLVKNFSFEKFLALGNLVDLFIDRGYGFNLDPQRKEDAGFIDFLELLNGILIDAGYLKPTMMLAVMGLKKMDPIVYHHWTPEFCVRIPDLH